MQELGSETSAVSAVSPASAQGTTVPVPAVAGERADEYEMMIHRWIERHKSFPSHLSVRGIHGTVVVFFELDRKGRLYSLRVQKSSGHAALDFLAKEQLALAAPFPRAPRETEWQRRVFSVPMTYRPLI